MDDGAERLVTAQDDGGFGVASLDPDDVADKRVARTEVGKAALRGSLAQGGEARKSAVAAAARWRDADAACAPFETHVDPAGNGSP